MFARARFNQYTAGAAAVQNPGLVRLCRRLPPGVVRNGVRAATFAESWLRWPLATLRIGDRIDETLAAIDADGTRFGLTPDIKRSIKRMMIYDQLADITALMAALEQPPSSVRVLTTKRRQHLATELGQGRGAIVAGFRTGAHAVFPWALAATAPAHRVTMIVGTEQLAALARALGRTFIADLHERVTFISAQDASVLTRTMAALKRGDIVATLLELSPVEFQRKTPVRFLDWTVDVPYGLSYLSAATGQPVVPAALTRRRGTRFRLEFETPVLPAERNQESMKEQTQALYAALEAQVRRAPEQWIGWMLLQSNMGIQLPVSGGKQLPALS